MGMELLDDGQLFLQKVFDDVPHGHVVGQSNSIANGDELSASDNETNTKVLIERSTTVKT